MMQFRPATTEDMDFISQHYHAPVDRIRPKIECLDVTIAEEGGVAVGLVVLEWLWSKVPYVGLIWVEPASRGRGVGTALLTHLEERLRDDGHVVLYSSSQSDEPEAQAWHRRSGFVECGVIEGINDGVGEVFFSKRIDNPTG